MMVRLDFSILRSAPAAAARANGKRRAGTALAEEVGAYCWQVRTGAGVEDIFVWPPRLEAEIGTLYPAATSLTALLRWDPVHGPLA